MPTTTAPALETTPKQIALIERLLNEKDVPRGQSIPGDRKQASAMIDMLFKQPARPLPQLAALTEGIYLAPNGDIIKLQKARSSSNLYAKVAVHKNTIQRLTLSGDIVDFDYVYAPGLVRHVTPAMRMTAEQAEEFAIKTGRCAWCKKHLKAAKSVAAGIGPVCIKRFQ